MGGDTHHWIFSGTLVLIGAGLFISAYPPWNLGILTGWVVLVPLIAAVTGATLMRAALTGWIFGFLANLGVFTWLFVVPGFHWYHFFLLDAYLAFYPALWTLLVARFLDRSVLAQVGLACAWVLIDFVRAHAGFLALPWITLAQSQVENTALLQTARVFGEPGISFLVILGNLAIWQVVKNRNVRCAWYCALPVLGATLLGTYALNHSDFNQFPHLRVGALGTEFLSLENASPDLETQMNALLEFVEQDLPSQVEIIFLPESALVNPKLFSNQIDKLQSLAVRKRITIVAGVAEAVKFDRPQPPLLTSPSKLRSGAWIISREGRPPQKYEKSRLVPFAEEVPMSRWINWPAWLVPPLTEVVKGPAPKSFPVPVDMRVGIMICWESLFADHARTLVNDDATLLVMLANEGWFGNTAAGAQHNLTARMRAVETHRSVIVASNMGPPLVIDPLGRVITGNFSDSRMRWATATVPIVTGRTLYTGLGELFTAGCGVFMLAMTATVRLQTRRVF